MRETKEKKQLQEITFFCSLFYWKKAFIFEIMITSILNHKNLVFTFSKLKMWRKKKVSSLAKSLKYVIVCLDTLWNIKLTPSTQFNFKLLKCTYIMLSIKKY